MSTRERRTLIRAGWVIAFDGRGHRLLRDGVVVMEAGRIVHVGPRFEGTVDETIDARDRVLTPGLISTHAHIGGSPLDRSFIEDRGSPQFWYSGLFEYLPVRGGAQDAEATRACIDFSMAELLRGGVTTVMEIGGEADHVVAQAGRFGLRVYMGLSFRSGSWLTRDGSRVVWEWNEEDGRRGLARAVAALEKHDGAHGDLVRCYFSPAQVDTCTPELLREAKRRADEARRPYTVHTAQSVVEFNEMLSRHGKTPIAWLAEPACSGRTPCSVTRSSWAARRGPTTRPAMCASWRTPAARWRTRCGCRPARHPDGVVRALQGRRVNMSLGTDTNPQSVIEAMRWAAVCSKIVERNTQSTTAADAFDAATLGGAARSAATTSAASPRARADLVLWKAASWAMTPLRDPVKNIVFNATAEDVDRVYVDGRLVVDGGHVLAADERAILAALQAAGERMWPHAAVRLGPSRRRPALAPDLPRVQVSRAARVGPRA